MLVLTRRLGEEIIIAGCIHVSVLSVNGNRVRIGVAAPDEVDVDRAEVHIRRKEFAAIDERVTDRNREGQEDSDCL